MSNCYLRFIKAANKKGGKEEAQRMQDEILDAVDDRVAEGERFEDALADEINKKKKQLTKRQMAAAQNFLKNQRTITDIKSRIESGEGIEESFVRYLEDTAGGQRSYETQLNGIIARYANQLEKLGDKLLSRLTENDYAKTVQSLLWDLSENKSPMYPDQETARVVKTIYAIKEDMRIRANNNGASIDKVPGGILQHNHDTNKMAAAGRDKWVNDMAKLLNRKTSFGGKFRKDENGLIKALQKSYDAMITGQRDPKRLEFMDEKFYTDFFGSKNLGRAMSRKRLFHFKNFTSFDQWNNTYGNPDAFLDDLVTDLQSMSQDIALLETFGTNPEESWKNIVQNVLTDQRDALSAKAQKKGKSVSDEVRKITNKAETAFNVASGKLDIPAVPRYAKIGSGLRAYQNIRSLGGVLLAQFGDVPLIASNIKLMQGKTYLGAVASTFNDVSRSFFTSFKDRQDFASVLGVYTESFLGHWRLGDDPLGKLQQRFFNVVGSTRWNNASNLAIQASISHYYARQAGKTFDQLDETTKYLFGRYDIESKDWDMLREAVGEYDGKSFIIADNIPDYKVQEKFAGFMQSQTKFSIITPGFREKRLATLGTQRGTGIGEFVRTVAQFKSFGITVFTRGFQKEIAGRPLPETTRLMRVMNHTNNIAPIVLTLTAMGYLQGMAKDLINNRTPKDPEKIGTWTDAVVRGGVMGLLGDFAKADTSGQALATLAGPSVSQAADILTTVTNPSVKKATNVALKSLPGQNIIYIRPVLDQLLINELREMVDPGSQKRMRRENEKKYNQKPLF